MSSWIQWVPFAAGLVSCGLAMLAGGASAQTEAASGASVTGVAAPRMTVLTPEEWQQLDAAVARSLAWMAAQQAPDGSFATSDIAQPGVTGLAAMAFLAGGYAPGSGQYGDCLTRAIDYVLDCQQPNGALTRVLPTSGYGSVSSPEHTAMYNHAVAGILLAEIYGMSPPGRETRIRGAIEGAIRLTLERQQEPKNEAHDIGGWRYFMREHNAGVDSDLSITGWQLMFLRAARNAGFEVPSEPIDAAVQYMSRCFKQDQGTFNYTITQCAEINASRAMAGTGIIALSLSGQHHTPLATQAAEYLLGNPITSYNGSWRFHYDVYYCSQAMFQMGGRYWEQFFPTMVRTLMGSQNPQGDWTISDDGASFGNVYTTALSVQALCVPNQLLPIYQR